MDKQQVLKHITKRVSLFVSIMMVHLLPHRSQGSDQPVHTRSLITANARRLNILGVFSY